MRNLLALAAAAVLTLGGVGWYLGWFSVNAKPSADGHKKLEIDVNEQKAKDDVGTGLEKIENRIQGSNPTNPQTPPATSPATGKKLRPTVIPGPPRPPRTGFRRWTLLSLSRTFMTARPAIARRHSTFSRTYFEPATTLISTMRRGSGLHLHGLAI